MIGSARTGADSSETRPEFAVCSEKQTGTASFADTAWSAEEVANAFAVRSVVLVGCGFRAGLQ